MNAILSTRRARNIGISIGIGSAVLLAGLAVGASAFGSESHDYSGDNPFVEEQLVVTGGKVGYEPATGAVTEEPKTTQMRKVDTRTGDVLEHTEWSVHAPAEAPMPR